MAGYGTSMKYRGSTDKSLKKAGNGREISFIVVAPSVSENEAPVLKTTGKNRKIMQKDELTNRDR